MDERGISREDKDETFAQNILKIMDKFTQVQIETRDILSRLVDKKEGEVNSTGSHQKEKKVFKEKILFKNGTLNIPI